MVYDGPMHLCLSVFLLRRVERTGGRAGIDIFSEQLSKFIAMEASLKSLILIFRLVSSLRVLRVLKMVRFIFPQSRFV